MEDFIAILKVLGVMLSPALTAVIAWKASAKKARSEVAGMDIGNLREVIKIYQATVADLEGLRDELKHEAELLRRENRELNTTLIKAQHENRELRANLDRLQRMMAGGETELKTY